MQKQDNQRQALLYAYMAGILDGEGCIGISKVIRDSKHLNWSPRYSAFVSVVNTNKEVIELFRKEFTPTYKGIIEKPPYQSSYRTQYRWRTPGNKLVVHILKMLLPYLRIKKMEAITLIKYCEGKKINGFKRQNGVPKKELKRREKYYLLLRSMKKQPQRLNEKIRESVKR